MSGWNKVKQCLKKAATVIKRYWWMFLSGLLLLFIPRRKTRPVLTDLSKLKKEKESELAELEKERERLKKEAENLEKTNRFDNPDDAVDYLNRVLRRIQDNQKK